MTLKARITEDMKASMKSGDKLRLTTVRMLISEIKYIEIAKRRELDDSEVIEIVGREVKKRLEAIALYDQGGRADLSEKEAMEAEILKNYLPTPLSASEIEEIITVAISETGATGLKEMGRVMAIIMPQVAGRADGAKVSAEVKTRLGGSAGGDK